MSTKSGSRKRPVVKDKPKKARITLECSFEQRKAIRILAAQQDKSMNDFLLSLVEKERQNCPLCATYGPNDTTIQAIEDIENKVGNEEHESIEEFWKSFYREVDAESKERKTV